MPKSNMGPQSRDALNQLKVEAASEVGVNLNGGYNGDLTTKQAGSVGGQMIKNMVAASNPTQYKAEAAREVGVDLAKGGDLTTKQAGSVGGQIIKKIVESHK